jgi:diaminopimelate decarboxylase
MHDFAYHGGELCCERVPLNRVARQAGTPVYVYSYATLIGHYRRLHRAFASVPHLICYSVKSNSNGALCRALAMEGSGFDIVSEGELRRVVRAGADPRTVVFAGVGKTEEEIAYALRKNILFFTVESEAELEAIDRVARSAGKKARIAVRVKPDVDPHTHRYITTGKMENKFGLDIESARRAYEKAMSFTHVLPVGVQMHIGSQITQTRPYVQAIRRVRPLVRYLMNRGVPLEYFDIGGGLGIVYNEETPATAERFADAVVPHLKDLDLKLILEPGRFIAGNAGVLLTKVVYLKNSGGKHFVIVDAGMNDLIRPSLYEAYHGILPVHRNRRRRIKADIVGPVCESGDFIAKNREIPAPRQGDILAVMGAGAYGFCMASNYNSRRRPAEVLVKGSRFYQVRERETFDDMMKREKMPPFLSR